MFVDEKAAGEKEPVKVGTLKLSYLIREGAKTGPQCFGVYYDGSIATCAIGAAMRAAGVEPRGLSLELLDRFFADFVPMKLNNEIFRRNDNHESREQIADWLESQGY